MSITNLTGKSHQTVADVMSAPAITVRDTDTFKHIVEVLLESTISGVPVVAEDGTVLGVVSEGDLMLKQEGQVPGRGIHPITHMRQQVKAERVYAADLMTAPAVEVDPANSIAAAAGLMQKRGVKRLFVVDGGRRALGVVTRSDLLKVFLRSDAEIRDEIVEGVVKRDMMIDTLGLEVGVIDGRVTITGKIERLSDIERIVRLVAEIDGVVDVQESLTYRIDDLVMGNYVGAVGPVAGVRGRWL